MKIVSVAVIGLVLAAGVASAQDSVPLRPIRPSISPAGTTQTLSEPAKVRTLQGDADAKLQALADQVAALQAQNTELKAKLRQIEAKVDANQSNQTAAVASQTAAVTNLQQSFKQHTHTYDRTLMVFKNVHVDDEWVSAISSVKHAPTSSSPPNE